MMSNNMMKDYLNEMQKYMISSQNVNAKQNDEEKGFIDRQINLDNSSLEKKMFQEGIQMNNFNIDENLLMNKDKLYETFLMFINSQQSLKSSATLGNARDINESQDFSQYGQNAFKKSLDLSITDLDKSLEKHTNSIKTYNIIDNNREERGKFMNNKNSLNNFNSGITQNIQTDNRNEVNVAKSIQIDNNQKNTDSNNNNNNNVLNNLDEELPNNNNLNEIKSFDDIPIKPKTTNFLELLEENLAKQEIVDNEGDGDPANAERIRRIRESKSKLRKNNFINVQAPGEAKKYKYYLQNFNKNFGKDKPEDIIEETPPIETKLPKSKLDDKKHLKKPNQPAPKKNSIRQEKNTKIQPSTNSTNASKTNMMSNYHTVNSESTKNNFTSNKKDSASIWGEKMQDDKKVDEFLNSLPKPTLGKNKKLSVKEEKLNSSHLTINQDYEIKMVNAQTNPKSNTNKQINNNNKSNVKTENISTSKKQTIIADNNNLKQYYQTNTINQIDIYTEKKILSDINIGENYKTNAARIEPLNFDNFELIESKAEKIDLKEENLNEKKNLKEDNYEKTETNINEDNHEANRKESFKSTDQHIENDSDDDRDIIRMYEEKVQNKSSKYSMREEKLADDSVKEDLNSYKKPEQSKIINKYFKPLIKETNKTKGNDSLNSETKSPSSNPQNPPENLQELVNEKINELNKEIEKMRKENEKVNKLKSEYERLTKKLNREIEEFNYKRQKETEEFEIWRDEEIKKMEKEKKVHLRNTKLLQNMPNRKEREEIDLLKEQVFKLQEEMKAKDQRNKLANERTKKQLDDALKRNDELQKELKYMEEMRVRNMHNATIVNRNRAPSRSIHLENTSGLHAGNVKINSHLSNNKSTNNLVSPPNKRIPPPKERSSGSFKLQQNQQLNRNNMNLSIKSTISENKNNYEMTSSEENVDDDEEQDKEMSDHSGEEDEESHHVNNIRDYYNVKNHSNKEEESEIKMNKGKVIKTNALTKNDSKHSSLKHTEENINKIHKNSIHNNTNGKLEPFVDNMKNNIPKERTSNSPKKENKKSSGTNILIKNNVDLQENYDLVFLDKYHGKSSQNARLLKQDFTEDGKIIKLYENMKKVVRFPSGVVKEIFEDGYQVTYFNNKDIKQVYPDKKEVYLFAENKTLQFKFPDGLHVFKFEGGLLEKHYPDGTKVVNYIDGRIRNVYPDGYEETFFPDGSLQKIDKNGIVTFDYEDGLKVFN